MTTKMRYLFLMVVILCILFVTPLAKADPPPDILDIYTVAITPQHDGSLVMSYTLQHYCTYSDWPSDQPYLQIGVPNSNFEITDWGPREGVHKVIEAEKITSEGFFVQLDFERKSLPKNGDCFDLYFTITQNKMAYPDSENGNVTFKFIPAGWDFPIQVKTLTVTWMSPGEADQLKLVEPNPGQQDGSVMIWIWFNPPMDASDMFHDATIKLAYDKSTFELSEAATTKTDKGNGGVPFDWQCCLTVVLIILLVLFVLFIIAVITEAYESGDGIGPAIVMVSDNVMTAVDEILSSSPGGAGGSSGRGSGCACAGCACACACAGGSKVGCSRKGIGVSCLTKVIAEMTEEKQLEPK